MQQETRIMRGITHTGLVYGLDVAVIYVERAGLGSQSRMVSKQISTGENGLWKCQSGVGIGRYSGGMISVNCRQDKITIQPSPGPLFLATGSTVLGA